jgi:hypothetical protein
VPTASDTPAYVNHFHANYPGDACDTNATTAVSTHSFVTTVGTAPCTTCTYLSPGLVSCVTKQNCPEYLTSGISMTSYIGNATGTATTTTGTSGPAFCRCDQAVNPSGTNPNWHNDCQRQAHLPCIIGQHALFPPSNGSSGWRQLSSTTTFRGITQLITPLPTTHQEYSDSTVASGAFNPNLAVSSQWNFPMDLGTFGAPSSSTSLTGVLWGSVQSFTPVSGESQPVANTPENYSPLKVEITSPPNFSNPRSVNPFPGCEICGSNVLSGLWGIDPGDPAWVIGVQGAPPIVQNIGSGSQLLGDRFGSGATAFLNNVANGTWNALVGDDVVAGVAFRSASLPVVLVTAGTLQVQGAFGVSGAGVVSPVSVSTDPPTAADPADLRSYDAADATLRALHVTSAGATVATVDVIAALSGNQTTTVTAIAGAVPVHPLAMAWSGAETSLYVVDAVPVGVDDDSDHRHRHAIRLVRINRDSIAEELWRLKADTLPDAALLTMSRKNEHVLTVVQDGRTEIATFDISGEPMRSLSIHGKPVAAPILVDAGFSVPLRRKLSPRPETELIDVRLLPRGATKPLLCGTHWLRRHVQEGSVLGDPRIDCEGDRDQDRDVE